MNLFSTGNPNYQRVERRKVGNAYSLPRFLESEEAIDSCIELFVTRLRELTQERRPIDLGVWLQYFAFDIVGEVTFASKLGFLEQGQDVDGMKKAIEGMLCYASLCGQMPELHKFLLSNPLLAALMLAMEMWNQVPVFTLKAINERASIDRDGELSNADSGARDMLSRWTYVKSSDPVKMSTRNIVTHLSGNVFGGSDTTAIALRVMIYLLCRNSTCMNRLVAEIDAADAAENSSSPISFREAASLPYLNAVLKESIRLHSSIGLLMERHVHPEGVEIEGHYLPDDTIVGINTWVTNHNEEDSLEPAAFKPERWLEATEQQLKTMETS